MKLPQEIMNKLFICAKKKIKIKVEGKNSLGQKFQTEGFILPKTNKDKPVFINENGIALYVGQVEKKENGKELPPYFAGFYTEYFDVNDIMYIKKVSIAKTGELIFENEDFENIVKKSILRNIEYYKRTLNLSPFAKKLATKIGNPMIIQNQKFVIKTVYMLNQQVCADCTNGYIMCSIPYLNEEDVKLDKQAKSNLENYTKMKKEKTL